MKKEELNFSLEKMKEQNKINDTDSQIEAVLSTVPQPPQPNTLRSQSTSSGRPNRSRGNRNMRTTRPMGPTNRQAPRAGSSSSTQQPNTQRKKNRYQRNRRDLARPIKRLPKVEREHERYTEAEIDSLKVIALGGLGEIGRNMTIFEYKDEIILVDAGLGFPEDDMPGVDYTIPNTYYLQNRKEHIKGMVVTHGHLDHIGAIPYIMNKIGNPPIYTADLTRGIILKRHQDFKHLPELEIEVIKPKEKVKLGKYFEVEPFLINHTIPDDLALIIRTPAGTVFHTSDYKFDPQPLNQDPVDFGELDKIGDAGIDLLMADSTGAEKDEPSMSETVIQENLDKIFAESDKMIIASTFSSLINRIQQLITLSEKYGRKVILDGFSLKNNVAIAQELKQINIKKETLLPIAEIDKYPREKITVIGTGAQGEGQAMLMRIASGEHRYIKLLKGDSVIFSSSVIPGNERSVQRIKDLFYRMGTKVYHYGMMDIHASGHGHKDDLKKMIKLIKPKFFMPIHGQYSMMVNHSYLAQEEGVPEKNIIIADNGSIVHVTPSEVWLDKKTIPADNVMVDGLGIGDIGNVVLRDRQVLAEDGMFVIIALVDFKTGKVRSSPDIISRGFVYLKENKDLLMEVRKKVRHLIEKKTTKPINRDYIKDLIRDEIGLFLFQRTERRPMVLPVVIEI
ncbi:MAG: ribonuclease J [Candidatus Yanofskybacteria bacterium CG10_big_fil_rev_8_21_14_0_10_36_16]|uniref:Ribonuclease J n=1 Tax=Candidatus Yanofskybacteria bacterium CG10_big_fil_rev_8_21_14_0_10_36_16 TaxID=1975096 RepID=A0A2J0Q7N8_9BACT|nr:MAG: ribonuclease J [Candidatus Yanofskybacteria bacterium CG10_big_fil_rev_8_21_14_0_10_36_16]